MIHLFSSLFLNLISLIIIAKLIMWKKVINKLSTEILTLLGVCKLIEWQKKSSKK